jgi:hypothetical protein
MGSNYGFVSPGGMAGNAIEQFLMQREQQERMRILDALEQKAQADRVRLSETELAQRGQQIAGLNADRDAQRAYMEEERGFRRANTIAENALPDDAVDPETAALLQQHGLGGQIRKVPGVVSQGAQIGEEDGIPLYDVTTSPEQMRMRGGSRYLNARAAEEARAGQAAEAQRAQAERAAADRAAADERANESNQTRMMIAGMGQGNANATSALQQQILQQRIDAENQKQQDKAESDRRSRDAARVTSGATIDVLKELADFDEQGRATLKSGTANLYGARIPGLGLIPGTDTANAQGAMDRLKGRVIVDLLNEMKNQSRTGATGFGALSGPELRLLENAASELNNPNIRDTRVASELERIYNMANQLYGGQPAAGAPAGGVVKWGRDANGKPVRLGP